MPSETWISLMAKAAGSLHEDVALDTSISLLADVLNVGNLTTSQQTALVAVGAAIFSFKQSSELTAD